MHKKLAAMLTIAIFAISTLAVVNPVSAHFTLGDLTGTFRYHANDFDPHVAGVIGYVWPGGGLDAYSGSPTAAGANTGPGYQSPYPGGNPVGAPSNSWYQLEGDTYAPFGAVLTGSTGDLIFAVNATAAYSAGAGHHWDYIGIFLPPGFTAPDASQVVTSFTNDYSNTLVVKASPYDRYCPSCTVVYIATDSGQSTTGINVAPYYNHQHLDFTSQGEWYYVRINGVTAPSVAGRYFFKILMGNTLTAFLGGEEGTNQAGAMGGDVNQFIPTENWPVMLVKGEVDPAILTGTVRYAGFNATLYSQPIQEAGKVWAKMTTRLDPYTGMPRPDLALVDAVGYFNATAMGHYEVEGLAPGVYDLYASAAGYPQTLVQSGFTVLKGQSLHFDAYLQPGAVIHGNVFTKHQFGDEPWPLGDTKVVCPAGSTDCSTGVDITGSYMKIELYAGPTLNHIVDSSAGPAVSWSPLPCIAGGQDRYYPKRDAGYCNDPRLGSKIAFPWHEYVPATGYGVPGYHEVSAGDGLGSGAFYNNLMQDPQGVGPAQHWFVQGGTTTPFHFEFGVHGEYGAPRDLDGMVPQVYATWVNGLTPGRYYARAWTFRYVQSALDGATFQEYYFDVTPNEWAGDVTLPIDLRLSSWVNKTVHFHNVVNGIVEDPIDTGAGVMSGVLVDNNNNVWSYNQTLLGYKGLYSDGAESAAFSPGANGSPASAFTDPSTKRHENDLDKAKLNQFAIETGRANIQFWGWNDTFGGENYGLPSGTYQPHVFVLGYLEYAPVEWVSVTLSGNPTSISDHVYRGAGFNITVYSIDWERPRVSRDWVWGQWGNGVRSGQLGQTPPFLWGEGYTANGGASSPPFGNFASPFGAPYSYPPNSMVGQEIDVGIYSNGSLVDFIGDETSLLADTVPSSCLFQNDTTTFVEACGGGWDVTYPNPNIGAVPNAAGTGYVPYQGNTNGAFFGQELKRLGFVGGYTGGSFYTLTAKNLWAPAHFSALSSFLAGQAGGHAMNIMYNSAATGYISLYPSAMPVNQQYDLRGYTYGYVQDKSFSAYAASGQVADMKINLVIGVNVSLTILFKKEHIITPTAANMSARVRLFDDSGNLVAEWMSSEGTYTTHNGFAEAANGQTQYPFNNLGDEFTGNGGSVPFPRHLNGYNFLPGGTTQLHVLLAGIPQVPAAGQNDGPSANFAPKGTYFMDPILAPGCDFELDCYNSPGVNWNNPGYFPNSGILGASDYQGGWTAEVDFVNWYLNNTGTQELLSNGGQTKSGASTQFGQYYPPVNGLLMGESFHIVPGTTASSGISLTEDLAMNTGWNGVGWSAGHSMAPNHLGPYSQEGVWQIANAHTSGEASAIFEVDLNGLVTGNALAFTWSNEFRPLSWGLVNVVGAQGGAGWNFYTYDGVYQAYLPPGTYSFTIGGPGMASQTQSIVVTSGMTGTGVNAYLEQSNIPVPEFSALAIVAFAALAASLYVLRRRRQ